MSKFFSLLKIIKGQSRKDLEVFLSMSSNQLPPKDLDIAQDILQRIYKRQKVEDDFFFKKYFPTSRKKDAAKNRQEWNRSKNRLYKACLRYFTLRQVEQHPLRGFLLLDFFQQEQLPKLGESSLLKEEKQLATLVDSNTVIYQYLLSEFLVKNNKQQRVEDKNFQQMEQQLDTLYLEKKLRCWCEKRNRAGIINRPHQEDPVLFSWIKKRMQTHSSIKASLYFHLYQMLGTMAGEVHFQFVFSHLRKQTIVLDSSTKKECFAYLLNYCIRQVNHGEIRYVRNYLLLIELLEAENLLLDNKKLSPIRFRNIISMSLIGRQNKWARDFLHRYQANLTNEGHRGVVELSEALILFSERKYTACENTLNGFDFSDRYHKLAYEQLKLKLDAQKVRAGKYDLMSFLTKLKNRRAFIRNQDWIDSQRKEKLINFLGVLPKVVKQKPFNLEKLKPKIYILDWVWLDRLVN